MVAVGAASASAETYVVRNTDDDGPGSLRQAIISANTNPNLPLGEPDRIHFAIPESGPQTVLLTTALPPITDAVVIDGFTQPGSRANGLAVGNDANLLIELNGINVADRAAPGLDVRSSNCVVRGVVIYRFGGDGVRIGSSTTVVSGNRVAGCFIGTNGAGTAASPNDHAVRVTSGATQNVIGGSAPADRNLLSGCAGGVLVENGANANVIAGNYIGTDRHGLANLANDFAIKVAGVFDTMIGGTAAGSGNVIIGKSPNPAVLDVVATGGGTKLQGNFVGLNATGDATLGFGGIVILTTGNLIGGTVPGARNVIASDGRSGLEIFGTDNRVQGNYIGSNASGTAPLGTQYGINLQGNDNRIGGVEAGARNVIVSSMSVAGLRHSIQGNYIGVNPTGSPVPAPPRSFSQVPSPAGVIIQYSDATVIGGAAAGARNTIAGGVTVFAAVDCNVQGNYIGTDATGQAAAPDGRGVSVATPDGRISRIADRNSIRFNVIAAAAGHGVALQGDAGTTVEGNFIGIAADGTTSLGVAGSGINIERAGFYRSGSVRALIVANTIAFCGKDRSVSGGGILAEGGGRNRFTANRIFANAALGIDLAGTHPQNASVSRAGVTPNDVGDTDSGPNTLQNYPLFTSVAFANGNATVKGTLNSAANGEYRLEFFASESVDDSGFGEGQFYLGFANVTTNASGDAAFEVTLAVPAAARSISATATDADGNTSEFSAGQGQLVNISTRGHVGIGDRATIGGFIISGPVDKRVLVRALGPSLTAAGVNDALADPTLQLFDRNGESLATNDDWQESQREEIEATTIAPTHEKEAAIVRTLEPGAYTAVVRGRSDTTGIGLVEVYDLSRPAGSRLANISTRGQVGTGENLMIGGFIIGPQGGGGARVAVRALGPSLASAGVPDSLADPVLELRDATGTLFARNDNWKENQAAVESTGLAPSHDAEAVVVTTLQPGNYTAIVRGRGDTVGVALVEIYNVQ